jgi:hypothetical protein
VNGIDVEVVDLLGASDVASYQLTGQELKQVRSAIELLDSIFAHASAGHGRRPSNA